MKKIIISLLAIFSLGCVTHAAQKSSSGWFNFFQTPDPIFEIQAPAVTQTIKPKIAVISLIGEFDMQQTMFQLTTVAKDTEIAGILLNIDCNGGSAAHFSALHDLIKKIREKKDGSLISYWVCVICGIFDGKRH